MIDSNNPVHALIFAILMLLTALAWIKIVKIIDKRRWKFVEERAKKDALDSPQYWKHIERLEKEIAAIDRQLSERNL